MAIPKHWIFGLVSEPSRLVRSMTWLIEGSGPLSKLAYYPTVTGEPFRNTDRLSTLLESGKLCADAGLPPLDLAIDRVMICGARAMMGDLKWLLEALGFDEGS